MKTCFFAIDVGNSDIVIALDKLDKIGIEKVKEEMSEKGVSNDSFLILDKFLSVNNISE